MKVKFTKNKIIAAALIVIVLAAAFWYGGGAPGLQGWRVSSSASDDTQEINTNEELNNEEQSKDNQDNGTSSSNLDNPDNLKGDKQEEEDVSPEDTPDESEKPAESEKPVESEKNETSPSEGIESRPGGVEGGLSATEKMDLAKEIAGGSSPGVEEGSKNYSEAQGMVIDSATGKDKYLTDPVPEGKPVPVEPENVEISDVEHTCTLSVRCDTILDNIDWLDKGKVELVPEDGVIFATAQVTFYEGESVFNVLQREMKKAKIHMEFVNTPMFNSAYIEGINNLYEFDCGELSGWMYKVNEWFPNYGCSRYQLKEGDKVEWVYTCNLGIDVGGYYSVGD